MVKRKLGTNGINDPTSQKKAKLTSAGNGSGMFIPLPVLCKQHPYTVSNVKPDPISTYHVSNKDIFSQLWTQHANPVGAVMVTAFGHSTIHLLMAYLS